MRIKPSCGALLVLLAVLIAIPALAQTAPSPLTWERSTATVLDPATGRSVDAMVGEVVVFWGEGISEPARQAVRDRVGAALYRSIVNTRAEVLIVQPGRESEVAVTLGSAAEVEAACLNLVSHIAQAFTPNDTQWTVQKPLHDLTNTPLAWNTFKPTGWKQGDARFAVGDRGVIIGIIDTGVDYEHPDLAPNIWRNPAEYYGRAGVDDDGNGYIDDVYGWDFYDDDADPKPRADLAEGSSHGTHVAGIAAAVGNNGEGVAGQAWDCTIMALKASPDDGSGLPYDAQLAAYRYAIDNGCDVVNMSYIGTGGVGDPQVLALFQEGFTAGGVPNNPDRNGINWVAGAGNNSLDIQDRYYPIAIETEANEVVGVAAVDRDATIASYSNWSTSPRVVDVSAPGGDFDTVQYLSTGLVVEGEDDFQERYVYMAGTSMASPHVAGLLGLIKSVDPTLPAAAVRDALLEAANRTLLYDANPTYESSQALGRGIPDAYASVQAVGTLEPIIAIISPEAGARIKTTLPAITFQVTRQGAKAPRINRVTLRLDPQSGDPVTDADAVWIDADGDGVDDRPADLAYPYRGQAYPEKGIFTVQLGAPLGIGSDGTSLHMIEVTVTDARAPEDFPPTAPDGVFRATSLFRVTAVGVGSGRRMFSVPYELIDRSVQPWGVSAALPATVFAQPFGGSGGCQIARWDPSQGGYVRSDLDGVDDPYIRVLQPGKGYWVDVVTATPRLIIQGTAISAGRYLLRDAAYDVASADADYLEPGWHQIGSPYDFAISLSAFLVETEEGELIPLAQAVQERIVRGALYRYADGMYVPTVIPQAVLEPFEGYWFRTLQRCKVYAVPAAAESGGTTTGSRSVEASLAWQFSIRASVADTDAEVTMASSPRATDAFDDLYDLEQPPPLDAGVMLWLGDAKTEGLIRDVRGIMETEAKWTVTAQAAANAEVALTWGDLRGLPRDYSAAITDEATGKTVSMRHEGAYRYRTGQSGDTREFTVVVRRVDPAAAFRVYIDDASVNARGTATVSFRLSEDAEVDCVVLNAAGRTVRTVTLSEPMAAGVRLLTWDGRSDAGSSLPAGQYRIEVRARNTRGEIARGTVSVSR